MCLCLYWGAGACTCTVEAGQLAGQEMMCVLLWCGRPMPCIERAGLSTAPMVAAARRPSATFPPPLGYRSSTTPRLSNPPPCLPLAQIHDLGPCECRPLSSSGAESALQSLLLSIHQRPSAYIKPTE